MAVVSPFLGAACSFVPEIQSRPWICNLERRNAEKKVLRCARGADALELVQAKADSAEPKPSPDTANAMQIALSSANKSAPHAQTERRRIVKIAWEKLVRWSRSWRLLNSQRATNVLQKTNKVVVLGGGSFGTAMAVLVAKNKPQMEVSMLIRDAALCQSINKKHLNDKYFPAHRLPENIMATTDARTALQEADFCIHAVPVQFSATVLQSISEHVGPMLPFVSVSKGLELNTLRMMSQIIPQALGNPFQPIVVLSGPSFAVELMEKLPTGLIKDSSDLMMPESKEQM